MTITYYRPTAGRSKPSTRRRYRITMTICCDAEMHQQLNDYAKKMNIPVSEAIRTFVEWGLEEVENGVHIGTVPKHPPNRTHRTR